MLRTNITMQGLVLAASTAAVKYTLMEIVDMRITDEWTDVLVEI